eukprot:4649462-Alexandrium_andersonii.AAC.1
MASPLRNQATCTGLSRNGSPLRLDRAARDDQGEVGQGDCNICCHGAQRHRASARRKEDCAPRVGAKLGRRG